jgi:GDP-4-dehydro-6-deoxy-D-mannose reductase
MYDVVVTGADGFMGRAVVQRFREAGTEVYAAGRRQGDIADGAFWRDLPPARVIAHLAGRSFVPDSWTDKAGFMQANVIGTQHALEWCKRHGANMVFASAYLYGVPQKLPIGEDDPVNPNNPYALSKRLAEQLCEFAALHEGVPVTVLRIFNVYGHGQRPEFLIPRLMSQMLSDSEVKVMDLEPRRDYIFIEDVVEAIVLAARRRAGYHCINIGSGTSLAVRDIIDIIQRVCKTDLPIVSSCETRLNEIPDVRADITRAKTVLGWKPGWDFESGIGAMLKELRVDRA